MREAELLGVVAVDGLTECGDALVAAVDGASDEVGRDCDGGIGRPASRGRGGDAVHGDLAVGPDRGGVGPADDGRARVLSVGAASESRGTAAVWRFSPASVRAALDAGWSAAQLVGELAAIADRPLPQPLEYLVNDVARRHGLVRVRGMRSCVLADEATVAEILHTRSLAKLQLARLAPTALSSPFELDEVLARLRAAGLSPVAEDALGGVVVEVRREHRASGPRPAARPTPGPRSAQGSLLPDCSPIRPAHATRVRQLGHRGPVGRAQPGARRCRADAARRRGRVPAEGGDRLSDQDGRSQPAGNSAPSALRPVVGIVVPPAQRAARVTVANIESVAPAR